MNFQLSIVIICKNEAGNIERAIGSIISLSDDIVVFDSGSTDGTEHLIKNFPIQLHHGSWEGFGRTREKAVQLSKNDWVLIIDADEVVPQALAEEIMELQLADQKVAYSIRLQNFIGNKQISHGTWGHDFRIRLYHKKMIHWNDLMVHEKLVIGDNIKVEKLKNTILHYTAKHMAELSEKMNQYALLTAQQYYIKGKNSTWLKRNFGGLFAFIKAYFIKLGFLDGDKGFRLAVVIAGYTRLKYKRLYELQKNQVEV